MNKEVLALDIDDVAFKHVEGFVQWSNNTWGTSLTPEDYTEAWHELWGIHPDEVEDRKRQFFTDDIVGEFEVIEGAGEGIAALSGIKKVVGVTSRRESLREVTESSLELIAPGSVDRVIFATYFKDGQKITRSKAEICSEIEASYLLDDQLKHCLAVGEIGVSSLLFGNYPWNKTEEDLPSSIARASNWKEVLSYFNLGKQKSTNIESG